MYNGNPYFLFSNYEIYLNPVIQFVSEKDKNNINVYNEIKIESFSFYLREDTENEKIYLISYWDTKKKLKYKKRRLNPVINEILEEIKDNK